MPSTTQEMFTTIRIQETNTTIPTQETSTITQHTLVAPQEPQTLETQEILEETELVVKLGRLPL
jgi:hypothetical protein